MDGVQGYLRVPFSFKETKVDSYALSAHKIHGPKGVGALVLADGARIKPIVAGGGQQGGLRSGTENTSGIAGMVAAVQSYPSDAMERMRGLKRLLLSLLTEALPETTVAGLPVDDPMSAGHILNVSFPPVRAETLLHALEADGICVGTGSACSSKKGRRSPVLTAMHLPPQVMDSAIRMSLCPFNTEEEMRYTAEKIIERVGVSCAGLRAADAKGGRNHRARGFAGSLWRNFSQGAQPPHFFTYAGGPRARRGQGGRRPCMAQ